MLHFRGFDRSIFVAERNNHGFDQKTEILFLQNDEN